jgi:serine/threonine protein kinase
MKPGLALRPGSLAQFREEIRLSREISSAHVCRVYDVGRHEESGADLIFLTMELLQGVTLADRIFLEGPLSLEAARPLIWQMAQGLDAAHLRGVLHRDFKSSNVMICPGNRDRVVITDFGLSRRDRSGRSCVAFRWSDSGVRRTRATRKGRRDHENRCLRVRCRSV